MSEKILAYHGTNVFFEKFDLRCAFQGEGYNLHGSGIYLAMKREVAEKYALSLSERFLFSPDGSDCLDLSFGVELRTVDSAVACVLHCLKKNPSLSLKKTIHDVTGLFSCGSKWLNLQAMEYAISSRLETVLQWTHNPGYVYTVEISKQFIGLSSTSKARAYVGQSNGVCLLVSDPDIINIVGVEEISSRGRVA